MPTKKLSKRIQDLVSVAAELETKIESSKLKTQKVSSTETLCLTYVVEAAKLVVDSDGSAESILALHKALIAAGEL
jgi:hypothetical protein